MVVFCTSRILLLICFSCELFCVIWCNPFDMPVKRSKPGLKAPKKAWWAREITKELHVAGRLTERQIKYASEAGFRSILSVYVYETEDAGSFGGEYLPTSAEAWSAARMSGMQYDALIGLNDEWAGIETVRKCTEALAFLRKPVLIYGDQGDSAAFVTLMYLANMTSHNANFVPKIYSEDFYRIGTVMGYDFTEEKLKNIVSTITGEDVIEDPPKPDTEPPNWHHFWLAHPVSKNIFTSGQIRPCDVKVLEEAGFKSIINVRPGLKFDGQPAQEWVTLLNIDDDTAIYGTSNTPPRQDPHTLKNSRLNFYHGAKYISDDSTVNFEGENPQEFGDDVGYNEELERKYIEEHSSLEYIHIPISLEKTKYSEIFDTVHKAIVEAAKKGPVLVQCAIGKRVAYLGVLSVAVQEGHGLEWALKKARDMGFEVSPETTPDIFQMYEDVLGRT